MKPRRVDKAWALSGIASGLIGCAIQLALVFTDLPLVVLLLLLPLIFVPNVVLAVIVRRERKRERENAEPRPVWAVITRPITTEETARLKWKGYEVHNMYVSGVRTASSPPEAALALYTDLADCMDGEYEIEELATRNLDSARRVVSLVGTADKVVADMLDMQHRRHSEGERREP